MSPLWTVFFILLTFTTPIIMSMDGRPSNDEEYYNEYNEEGEKISRKDDLDDVNYPQEEKVGQNLDYQDESAFIQDAQSWRKVIQQQGNYEVKSKPDHPIIVISDPEENNPQWPQLIRSTSTTTTTTTSTEEPYEKAIERLSCDNPWFWNAIKCFYLDVRERNYVDRTTSNGKTAAWILGPPVAALLLTLIAFLAVTCYFKSRVKALERRMEDIRTKYEPGSIELDDGTVRKYTPNQEEIDAFENMIETLISIV